MGWGLLAASTWVFFCESPWKAVAEEEGVEAAV